MFNRLKKQQLHVGKKSELLKKNAKKMSNKMTWPEKEFEKMLNELGVKFETQKIVGNKIYDFYIPGQNILFEIDGDYYHSHPDIYEEHDLNPMQKRNKKNDKFKNTLALGLGYFLERIWESDLKENYENVKNNVKNILRIL